jgi:hypothetical protein
MDLKQRLFPHATLTDWFLDALEVLRNVTISSVMSGCLFVRLCFRVEQLGSHLTEIHEI